MDQENIKILAVDDNPKNLKVLAAILAPLGYQVDYVFNGTDALKMMKDESYDLVLLDIMMPGMDGYETCIKMKSLPNKDLIPVIFLTARTDVSSLNKAFTSGGVDYITKPFSPEELIARVKTHVELKSSRQKLLKVNAWLEQKVEERTEDLRKAHEELEKAYRSLQSLDKAKTDFLHMINHEVRTPLNAILGFTGILQDEVSSPELRSHIDYIYQASVRLEKFLAVVLQLTELIAREKLLVKKELNFNQLIQPVLQEYEKQIREKDLRMTIEPRLNQMVLKGDEKLIRSCLRGVIENAVEYSPQSGEISIKVCREGELTGCMISDQGPGFSQKSLDRMFSIFGSPDEHIDENIGLDLALSRLIMDAHQGKILAGNDPRGGAEVRLLLP